jgi:hypothetical protein
VYLVRSHALGMAAGLWVAATGAMAAEDVVILDVTGKWERVSAVGQSLTNYQHLQVKERIRFVIAEPFLPGTLVLADLKGARYYSKECKSREPCDGVLEVPPVPPRKTVAADAAPSILERMFKPLTEFIGRDDSIVVILMGNPPTMGGILRDGVLALNGEFLDLCDSVGAINPGQYTVTLSSPSSTFNGQLTWTGKGTCTARVIFQKLTPGIYTMKTVDSHGASDTALVLVCSSDRYEAASKEFRELSEATRNWLQAGSEGFAIRESARRDFLAGYLLWHQVSPGATPPDAAGKRDR